jgi:hypothetical protein
MKNKLPVPVCTAFLTCRGFAIDQRNGDEILIGLPRAFWSHHYPAATNLTLFMRCTSGHGNYTLEIQLQSADGELVWKEGPPKFWEMLDPLEMYDYTMKVCVGVFKWTGSSIISENLGVPRHEAASWTIFWKEFSRVDPR